MKIAVIGTGISGLSAAYGLADRHELTVYEAQARLGGHSATVDVETERGKIAVDTGFIVYNQLNYPQLTQFFAELGVTTHDSDMSFSVSLDRGALEWAGDTKLWKLFAQPSNLFKPSFWWMLKEVTRFNTVSRRDRAAGVIGGRSLGDYLTWRGFSRGFQTDYLIPMGAAIWSTAVERMLDFPAEAFIAFFDNHRLLSFDRPVWRTVTGGSRCYVEKIAARLKPCLRLSSAVTRVTREAGGVRIEDVSGHQELFDQAVLATHSDQALAVLGDAGAKERAVLSAIRYEENDVWLHSDASLMPKRRAAWSAWNFLSWPSDQVDSSSKVTVSYWMNRLQGIDRSVPLFVTLNPPRPPEPRSVYGRYRYAHPQLDGAALAAQQDLPSIQGVNRVWFAGAWTGFGFHEDGLKSGIAAAEALGGAFGWRPGRPAPLSEPRRGAAA